jgi:hypothetical protein
MSTPRLKAPAWINSPFKYIVVTAQMDAPHTTRLRTDARRLLAASGDIARLILGVALSRIIAQRW